MRGALVLLLFTSTLFHVTSDSEQKYTKMQPSSFHFWTEILQMQPHIDKHDHVWSLSGQGHSRHAATSWLVSFSRLIVQPCIVEVQPIKPWCSLSPVERRYPSAASSSFLFSIIAPFTHKWFVSHFLLVLNRPTTLVLVQSQRGWEPEFALAHNQSRVKKSLLWLGVSPYPLCVGQVYRHWRVCKRTPQTRDQLQSRSS